MILCYEKKDINIVRIYLLLEYIKKKKGNYE